VKKPNSFVVSSIVHLAVISSLFIHFNHNNEEKKIPDHANFVLTLNDIPITPKITQGKIESNKVKASKSNSQSTDKGKGDIADKKESYSEKDVNKEQPSDENSTPADIQQGINKPILSDDEAIQGFKNLLVPFFIKKDDKLPKEWYDENGEIHRELIDFDYKKYAGTIWVKATFSEDGVVIPDSIEVAQKSDNMSDEAVEYWLSQVKKIDMAARYRKRFTVIFPICIRAVLDDKIIDGKDLNLYPPQCEPLKK
jgi:hypothetical protein